MSKNRLFNLQRDEIMTAFYSEPGRAKEDRLRESIISPQYNTNKEIITFYCFFKSLARMLL